MTDPGRLQGISAAEPKGGEPFPGLWRRSWEKFKKNRIGMAALTTLGVLFLVSLLADVIPKTYDKDDACGDFPPLALCSEGGVPPFGTDQFGHDLFSRTLKGGRVTLSLAVIVVLLNLGTGTALGMLAGYRGGWVDTVVQRMIEIVLAIPRLALLLATAYIIWWQFLAPEGPRYLQDLSLGLLSYAGIIVILWLTGWAPLAQIIRGEVLALREEEFLLAAKALGADIWHVFRHHLLRNLVGTLIVAATLAVPDIIILESVLSWFGYGIQGEWVSWGSLLNAAGPGSPLGLADLKSHLWRFIPALFILVTILAFNLLGDALRDAFEVQ